MTQTPGQKRIPATNLPGEKWKTLGIYADYEISNKMRVKAKAKTVIVLRKGQQVERNVPAKILRPIVKSQLNRTLYAYITLYFADGRSKSKYVNIDKAFAKAFPELAAKTK